MSSCANNRLGRLLFRRLAQFCRIDLEFEEPNREDTGDDDLRARYSSKIGCDNDKYPQVFRHKQSASTCVDNSRIEKKPQQQQQQRRRRQTAHWPLVLSIYHLYCCIKATINTYYQYLYDLRLYQFRSLVELGHSYGVKYQSIGMNHSDSSFNPLGDNSTTTTTTSASLAGGNYSSSPASEGGRDIRGGGLDHLVYDLQARARELELKLLEAEEFLKWIGSPMLKFSYFSEITYLYIGGISFLTYLVGPLYFKYIAPYDFRFARVILNADEKEDEGEEEATAATASSLELVRQEVDRFLVSSQNYTQATLDNYLNLASSNLGGPQLVGSPNGAGRAASRERDQQLQLQLQHDLRRIFCDQLVNSRQLRALVLGGQLRPLNGSRARCRQLARYNCQLIFACLLYALLVFVVFLLSLSTCGSLTLTGDHYTASDVLMLAEVIYLALTMILAVVFYIATIFSSCIDQIMYMGQLDEIIADCARLNTGHYWLLVEDQDQHQRQWRQWRQWRPHYGQFNGARTRTSVRATYFGGRRQSICHQPSSRGRHSIATLDNRLLAGAGVGAASPSVAPTLARELATRQMNGRLLFAFMHFRIFVAESERERRSYAIFAWVAVLIFFTLPIMARLHEPYVSQETKYVQLFVCLATVMFLNFVLAPICLLHQRALDIYKSLCSLLAQTVATSSLQAHAATQGGGGASASASGEGQAEAAGEAEGEGGRETVQLYNGHLVWLLRKELSYPEIFMRQFATVSFGIHFTFPNLVKIHFWFGVIMLSLLNGVTSGQDTLFGGFLSDPFGVYHKSL